MASNDSAYGSSEDGREASKSPERAAAAAASAASAASAANGPAIPGAVARSAVAFAQQSEKLSHHKPDGDDVSAVAVEAQFITPHDPVVVTSEGSRLPGVPLLEAHKLNMLRDELATPPGLGLEPDERTAADREAEKIGMREERADRARAGARKEPALERSQEGSLRKQMPPFHTNPLFPPLPLYGPPTLMRDLQCALFRVSSFFLSLAFLGVIVLGALFTSIPAQAHAIGLRLTGRNPDARRPFYEEELRRSKARQEQAKAWKRRRSQERLNGDKEDTAQDNDNYVPTEGGPDPIKCDVGYYARRVGLDVEEFRVQTEDGFIIDLWHVFDPKEYTKLPEEERKHRGPDLFTGQTRAATPDEPGRGRKFPVLLVHGLLQSAGAYCVNDDDSLAFYLCKSGYDVWLGNNRCGFRPKHVLLDYSDPRMWCWNIRQMGVFDLPALTSRVLYETGFDKIGLVCHSQGTTEALVALAKEQRPELGERLTVFCALAPAAYAGPLIGKMYFKFMRVITPAMFRLMFGIHAFIPFMMDMHALLPPWLYGWLGYQVFSFLFNWSDRRWDRGLRDRMFQFAPVYVSSESMRWWLGRECFARQKCILATKEEWRAEEREDNEAAQRGATAEARRASEEKAEREAEAQARRTGEPAAGAQDGAAAAEGAHRRKPRGATAWYNEQAPPFALWVAGRDDLVDGGRLLRRFERGREPHVRLVHKKVIPDYEHLDVLWAMDAVDQVFVELREVLWKTCHARDRCRVPTGCEEVGPWLAEPAGKEKEKGEGEGEEREEGDEGDEGDESPSSSSGDDAAA